MPDSSRQRKPRRRAWSTRMVGTLLVLQAITLFLLFPLLAAIAVWQSPVPVQALFARPESLLSIDGIALPSAAAPPAVLRLEAGMVELSQGILTSLFYLPLSLPVLLVAILFLAAWRPAWLGAVFLQGLILVLALVFYFGYRPSYVYVVMLYSIVLVTYLNHSDVRHAFQEGTTAASGKTRPRGAR